MILPHHAASDGREAALSLFGYVADPCAPGYFPGLSSLPTLLSPLTTPDFLCPLLPHAHLQVGQLVLRLGSQLLAPCPCMYACVSLGAVTIATGNFPSLPSLPVLLDLFAARDFLRSLFPCAHVQVWRLVLCLDMPKLAPYIIVCARVALHAPVHIPGMFSGLSLLLTSGFFRSAQDFACPLFLQAHGQAWQLVLCLGMSGLAPYIFICARAAPRAPVHVPGIFPSLSLLLTSRFLRSTQNFAYPLFLQAHGQAWHFVLCLGMPGLAPCIFMRAGQAPRAPVRVPGAFSGLSPLLMWLILATAVTGTFTDTRFHTPRAPTAPAMAPVARAGPGGMAAKLAGPEQPGSGDVGLLETSKVASLALPRPGCIGWVVV